jgi:ComF family protein
MRIYRAARRLCQALVFPQACVLCDRWVANTDLSPLCRLCSSTLESPDSPHCHYCGLGLPGSLDPVHSVCSFCREPGHAFDNARSTGPYQGRLRDVIRKFKFEGWRRLAWPLAARLEEVYRSDPLGFAADWVVPVPLHSRRKRERGFDQTLLLTQVLGGRLRLPLFTGLRRTRYTCPQFGLDRHERAKNLQGAFVVEGAEQLAGTSVLLVDDIMTTGATADEICALIRSHVRVDRLLVLTVARAPLLRPAF